eukprot:Blabericola_migrator_1__7451@NODE_379_length_9201_cov_80_346179_g303_i0_p1_GENE_NODE_379_length_9201_cov_80_346179_g303_i0NODE_379_length_9201_cov_80_346179_g303_i0_p1_ORF_typecomplete_len2405_score368_32AAA_34/PF13872_6/6_3e23Helicase_C_4/PF13871_6/1_6e21DUF2345/PF10106_9/0_19_NODE_379_length_9201_cov_80_346179_g303_i017438957
MVGNVASSQSDDRPQDDALRCVTLVFRNQSFPFKYRTQNSSSDIEERVLTSLRLLAPRDIKVKEEYSLVFAETLPPYALVGIDCFVEDATYKVVLVSKETGHSLDDPLSVAASTFHHDTQVRKRVFKSTVIKAASDSSSPPRSGGEPRAKKTRHNEDEDDDQLLGTVQCPQRQLRRVPPVPGIAPLAHLRRNLFINFSLPPLENQEFPFPAICYESLSPPMVKTEETRSEAPKRGRPKKKPPTPQPVEEGATADVEEGNLSGDDSSSDDAPLIRDTKPPPAPRISIIERPSSPVEVVRIESDSSHCSVQKPSPKPERPIVFKIEDDEAFKNFGDLSDSAEDDVDGTAVETEPPNKKIRLDEPYVEPSPPRVVVSIEDAMGDTADTGVVDTTGTCVGDTANTDVADAGVGDTAVADTGVVDTGVVDTGVADTGVADASALTVTGGNIKSDEEVEVLETVNARFSPAELSFSIPAQYLIENPMTEDPGSPIVLKGRRLGTGKSTPTSPSSDSTTTSLQARSRVYLTTKRSLQFMYGQPHSFSWAEKSALATLRMPRVPLDFQLCIPHGIFARGLLSSVHYESIVYATFQYHLLQKSLSVIERQKLQAPVRPRASPEVSHCSFSLSDEAERLSVLTGCVLHLWNLGHRRHIIVCDDVFSTVTELKKIFSRLGAVHIPILHVYGLLERDLLSDSSRMKLFEQAAEQGLKYTGCCVLVLPYSWVAVDHTFDSASETDSAKTLTEWFMSPIQESIPEPGASNVYTNFDSEAAYYEAMRRTSGLLAIWEPQIYTQGRRGGLIAYDDLHTITRPHVKGSRDEHIGEFIRKLGKQLAKDTLVVYGSAVNCLELPILKFLDRLGLWGPHTYFQQFSDFEKIMALSDKASKEFITLDLKCSGKMSCRMRSWRGIEVQKLCVPVTQKQIVLYNNVVKTLREIYKVQSVATEVQAPQQLTFWADAIRCMRALAVSFKLEATVRLVQSLVRDKRPVVITLWTAGSSPAGEASVVRSLLLRRVEECRLLVAGTKRNEEPGCLRKLAELKGYVESETTFPSDFVQNLVTRLGGNSKVAVLSGRLQGGRCRRRSSHSSSSLMSSDLRTNSSYHTAENRAEIEAFRNGRKRIAILNQSVNASVPGELAATHDGLSRAMVCVDFPWNVDRTLAQMSRVRDGARGEDSTYYFVISDSAIEQRVMDELSQLLRFLGASVMSSRTDRLFSQAAQIWRSGGLSSVTQEDWRQVLRRTESWLKQLIQDRCDWHQFDTLYCDGVRHASCMPPVPKEIRDTMSPAEFASTLQGQMVQVELSSAHIKSCERILNRLMAVSLPYQNMLLEYFLNLLEHVRDKQPDSSQGLSYINVIYDTYTYPLLDLKQDLIYEASPSKSETLHFRIRYDRGIPWDHVDRWLKTYRSFEEEGIYLRDSEWQDPDRGSFHHIPYLVMEAGGLSTFVQSARDGTVPIKELGSLCHIPKDSRLIWIRPDLGLVGSWDHQKRYGDVRELEGLRCVTTQVERSKQLWSALHEASAQHCWQELRTGSCRERRPCRHGRMVTVDLLRGNVLQAYDLIRQCRVPVASNTDNDAEDLSLSTRSRRTAFVQVVTNEGGCIGGILILTQRMPCLRRALQSTSERAIRRSIRRFQNPTLIKSFSTVFLMMPEAVLKLTDYIADVARELCPTSTILALSGSDIVDYIHTALERMHRAWYPKISDPSEAEKRAIELFQTVDVCASLCSKPFVKSQVHLNTLTIEQLDEVTAKHLRNIPWVRWRVPYILSMNPSMALIRNTHSEAQELRLFLLHLASIAMPYTARESGFASSLITAWLSFKDSTLTISQNSTRQYNLDLSAYNKDGRALQEDWRSTVLNDRESRKAFFTTFKRIMAQHLNKTEPRRVASEEVDTPREADTPRGEAAMQEPPGSAESMEIDTPSAEGPSETEPVESSNITDIITETATDNVTETAGDSVTETAGDSVTETAGDSVTETATDSVAETASELPSNETVTEILTGETQGAPQTIKAVERPKLGLAPSGKPDPPKLHPRPDLRPRRPELLRPDGPHPMLRAPRPSCTNPVLRGAGLPIFPMRPLMTQHQLLSMARGQWPQPPSYTARWDPYLASRGFVTTHFSPVRPPIIRGPLREQVPCADVVPILAHQESGGIGPVGVMVPTTLPAVTQSTYPTMTAVPQTQPSLLRPSTPGGSLIAVSQPPTPRQMLPHLSATPPQAPSQAPAQQATQPPTQIGSKLPTNTTQPDKFGTSDPPPPVPPQASGSQEAQQPVVMQPPPASMTETSHASVAPSAESVSMATSVTPSSSVPVEVVDIDDSSDDEPPPSLVKPLPEGENHVENDVRDYMHDTSVLDELDTRPSLLAVLNNQLETLKPVELASNAPTVPRRAAFKTNRSNFKYSTTENAQSLTIPEFLVDYGDDS